MTSFVGFLHGANKYGRWVPEAELKARAIVGGSTLDFSQALFTHPVITIHATAFWGGVTLIVPPNVMVEQSGRAILGGFGSSGGIYHSSRGPMPETASGAGITIKVVGTAVMGAVTAVVNQRAEAAQLLSWEAAQRLLLEPAPPSTTKSDVRQQLLDQALAHKLQKLQDHLAMTPAGVLERALAGPPGAQAGGAQQCQASLSTGPAGAREIVVQGMPVVDHVK